MLQGCEQSCVVDGELIEPRLKQSVVEIMVGPKADGTVLQRVRSGLAAHVFFGAGTRDACRDLRLWRRMPANG